MNINSKSAITLSKSLIGNRTLIKLNLSGNIIGSEAAPAFADLLKSTDSALLQLHLGCNNLGSKGGTIIGFALKENKVLQGIDLRHNNIGPTAAAIIAEALQINTSLKDVYLEWNAIRDEGSQAFEQTLEVNLSMRFLTLPKWSPSIHKRLKQNRRVQDLFIQATNIAPKLLPEVLGKADRITMFHFCFQTRLDLVVSGLQSRSYVRRQRRLEGRDPGRKGMCKKAKLAGTQETI